jgi:hypothetical protein
MSMTTSRIFSRFFLGNGVIEEVHRGFGRSVPPNQMAAPLEQVANDDA